MEEKKYDVAAAYNNLKRLDWLNDRDEEIWQPIFALCKVFAPERFEELVRISVDMSTEKQSDAVKESKAAERVADDAEDKVLLIRDMLTVIGAKQLVPAKDMPDKLHSITTAKWRKFRGKPEGLTSQDIGYLLKDVETKNVKIKGKQVRCWRKADLEAVARLVGLME